MQNLIFDSLQPNTPLPMDLFLLADPSEELVLSYLKQGRGYTAQSDGKTVGAAIVMETAPGTWEVMNLAVKEELHNKGIGKALLKYIIEQMRSEGVEILEIGTGNPGVVQMLLYQKCGFRIVGVDPDFFRRTHPEERIYENGIECRDMIRMRMNLKEEETGEANLP